MFNLLKYCVLCERKTNKIICDKCNQTLKKEIFINSYVYKLEYGNATITTLTYYSGIFKELIDEYKFICNKKIASIFADILRDNVNTQDCIFVPIPSSATGLRMRGFNQIEEVLIRGKINYIDILQLSKDFNSKEQKKLNKKERQNISKKKFHIHDDVFNEQINKIKQYKNIIVLDDIFTTGSTVLTAVSKIYEKLTEHNIQNINLSAIVFARTKNIISI